MALIQVKKCETCGAEIPVPPSAREVTCLVCGSTYDVVRAPMRVNGITVARVSTWITIALYDEELAHIIENTTVKPGTICKVTGQVWDEEAIYPVSEAVEVVVKKRINGGTWETVWRGWTRPFWVEEPANYLIPVTLDQEGTWEFQAICLGSDKYWSSESPIVGC